MTLSLHYIDTRKLDQKMLSHTFKIDSRSVKYMYTVISPNSTLNPSTYTVHN